MVRCRVENERRKNNDKNVVATQLKDFLVFCCDAEIAITINWYLLWSFFGPTIVHYICTQSTKTPLFYSTRKIWILSDFDKKFMFEHLQFVNSVN